MQAVSNDRCRLHLFYTKAMVARNIPYSLIFVIETFNQNEDYPHRHRQDGQP